MFYTLNNGETIEIDIFEDENYEKYISFKLFGGSTVINYRCKERNNLNEILSEIEADYEQLKEEDRKRRKRAWNRTYMRRKYEREKAEREAKEKGLSEAVG